MTVHVYPVNDLVGHDTVGTDCVCGPTVTYVDDDTGAAYPDGPVVTHHSLDGREHHEMT